MSPPTRKRRVKRNANTTHQQPEVIKRQLLDLPLEVLVQIFQYLGAVDILYLARTTKELRAFLLDRHRSHRVWKTAIGNVPDFPPCPDHLSEPAYTHLAFVPVCHGCFEHYDTIDWELRMRCCSTCVQKMTVLPIHPRQDQIRQIARAVHLPVAESHYELHGVAIVPVELGRHRHRLSDWEAFLKRFDRGSIERFVVKERKKWRNIVKHTQLCREWEYKQLNERRLEIVRETRVNDIKTNLKLMGWKDDAYFSPSFLEIPGVWETELLTPDEWSKISSKIIASLSEVNI